MNVTCPECRGTGLKLPLCDSDCSVCNGSGQISKVYKKKAEICYPNNEDGELVKKLNDMEELTDWEIMFCNSVTKQVLGGHRLYRKQKHKIEEIMERYQ